MKMRITFVLPASDLSGGVRVVAVYANALTRRGHEVSIVSPPARPRTAAQVLRSLFFQAVPGAGARRPASHLEGLPVEHRVLERWRPVRDADVADGDVVVATWWETAEWVSALSEQKGAKVYFIQGHEVFPYLPVERCRATYRLPFHKIVVAKWLRDTMQHDYGDRDVDLVPNAVDKVLFHAPPRTKQAAPTVGFIYSMTPLKGLDVLLVALNAVQARMPNVRFIAFGTEKPSVRLPVPRGTVFTLRPPQTTLKDLYSRCDVWLSASRTEGFNLPALEAMACRTPVIATRTGWPAEAIASWRNGVLVEIDDADAIASATVQLLSLRDDQWRQLSERAYLTASALSWDESVDRFERALFRACSRAARGEIAGRPAAATRLEHEGVSAR